MDEPTHEQGLPQDRIEGVLGVGGLGVTWPVTRQWRGWLPGGNTDRDLARRHTGARRAAPPVQTMREPVFPQYSSFSSRL